MILFDVGGFLWGVLQLHGHFFQFLVKLFEQKKDKLLDYIVLFF